MTNAEKFLKNEVSAREFREKLGKFIFGELGFYDGTEERIDKVIGDFLDMIEKPTLTEDERVILRNIEFKDYNIIGRKESGDLYVNYQENDSFNGTWFIMFKKHLFQFIKERRRI